eukprot:365089-Chlamydomonas_euryale.AAC.5
MALGALCGLSLRGAHIWQAWWVENAAEGRSLRTSVCKVALWGITLPVQPGPLSCPMFDMSRYELTGSGIQGAVWSCCSSQERPRHQFYQRGWSMVRFAVVSSARCKAYCSTSRNILSRLLMDARPEKTYCGAVV